MFMSASLERELVVDTLRFSESDHMVPLSKSDLSEKSIVDSAGLQETHIVEEYY